MRKIFTLIFLLLLFGVILQFPNKTFALAISYPSLHTIPSPIQNILGQSQYYSVTFRGNGEAVVALKTIINNVQDTQLSTINLQFPDTITPSDITVYQVTQQPQCIRYKPWPIYQENTPPLKGQFYPNDQVCEAYQNPTYEYISDNSNYQKIPFELRDNTLIMQLPTPIKPNGNGSYFVYFRTRGYAQKNIFGAFEYIFSTLQSDKPVSTIQIGITTDSDLLLRGVKGNVNYQTQTAMAFPKSMGAVNSNPQLNDFYNQIGQGIITKTASDLQAGENYTVKGSYADNRLKLYGRELALSINTVLIVVIIFILFWNYRLKKFVNQNKNNHVSLVHDRVRKNGTLFLLSIGISFLSTFFLGGYIAIAFLFTNILLNNGYFYQFSLFVPLLVVSVSIAVIFFLLFAPAIVIAIKKGILWGVITLLFTMMWIIIFLIISFAIVFFFFPNMNTPYPVMNPLQTFNSEKAVSPSSVRINNQ